MQSIEGTEACKDGLFEATRRDADIAVSSMRERKGAAAQATGGDPHEASVTGFGVVLSRRPLPVSALDTFRPGTQLRRSSGVRNSLAGIPHDSAAIDVEPKGAQFGRGDRRRHLAAIGVS